MQSEWPVSRLSSLEANNVPTMKLTPDKKMVYPVPCSWRLPSPRNRISLRTAMSAFNLDSSRAIRAEWRLGRLLLVASSIVLTFNHAIFCIFAPLEVDAYLPHFRVFGPVEKMPADRAKPSGDERRASIRPPFRSLSPSGASSTVP